MLGDSAWPFPSAQIQISPILSCCLAQTCKINFSAAFQKSLKNQIQHFSVNSRTKYEMSSPGPTLPRHTCWVAREKRMVATMPWGEVEKETLVHWHGQLGCRIFQCSVFSRHLLHAQAATTFEGHFYETVTLGASAICGVMLIILYPNWGTLKRVPWCIHDKIHEVIPPYLGNILHVVMVHCVCMLQGLEIAWIEMGTQRAGNSEEGLGRILGVKRRWSSSHRYICILPHFGYQKGIYSYAICHKIFVLVCF